MIAWMRTTILLTNSTEDVDLAEKWTVVDKTKPGDDGSFANCVSQRDLPLH